jgi:hypothetical protein
MTMLQAQRLRLIVVRMLVLVQASPASLGANISTLQITVDIRQWNLFTNACKNLLWN